MKRPIAARVRSTARSVASGARPALSIGAWLTLTVLFTVVGVGTVGWALGGSRAPPAAVGMLVGVLGAAAVAPTLARIVVVSAAERFENVLKTDGERASSSLGSHETDRDRHITPCPCYS